MPPATVGVVKGLSVAEELAGGPAQGVIFPIRVRAVKGSGRLVSNAPVDLRGLQSILDAFAYLRARARIDATLPTDFPDGYDYLFTFPEPSYIVSGDSAGSALAVAIFSAVTGIPVLDDVAITGAISPNGSLRSVGSIELKLEGVLRSQVGTMILPAENWVTTTAEAAAIAVRAYPRTRLIFARNLDEVFFNAFGPYGPQREDYGRYTASLESALRAAQQGRFESSLKMLDSLTREMPGDTTAAFWSAAVGRSYAQDVVGAGQRALLEGRWEDAQWCADRALRFSPDSPEARLLLDDVRRKARQPSFLGTPGRWPPWGSIAAAVAESAAHRTTGDAAAARGEALLPLTAGRIDRLSASWRTPSGDPFAWAGPMREMWERAEPRAVESGEWRVESESRYAPRSTLHTPRELLVAAVRDDQRLALLIAAPDANDRVDLDEGAWVLGPEGFSRQGHEDRVEVVWSLRGSGPVPLDLARGGEPVEPPADLWQWGAGTTNPLGVADDLFLAPAVGADLRSRPDEGAPPAAPNSQDGRPARAFDGAVGAQSNPHILDENHASPLSGNPVRGREEFALRCASCHNGTKERSLQDIVWEPAGSAAHLQEILTRGSMAPHTGIGNAPDLIAYLRSASPIPGYVLQMPTGSRADVQAFGVFEESTWYLVFVRDLVTGHADDLPFSVPGTYTIEITVRDGGTETQYRSAPIVLALE